jgi:alkanesulfonate monooxygenase SsuD/methylene tetrahydromethanopterin reductase-like flavin-dependent oxidoreductase (luciferase family)
MALDFGYFQASYRTVDRDGTTTDDPTTSVIERAKRVDATGFEWFSVMDHLGQLTGHGFRTDPFLECYAALSAVAPVTDDVTLSSLVTCPQFRNPGYLAKLVATLDHLSGGRAMLGIGAGWCRPEYEAIDVEFPPTDERVRRMRDVIELCETAWTHPSPVSHDGRYHSLEEFYLEPKPGDVPVLVGGGGEELTLRAVAEYADWWNVPHADPSTYAHKMDVLDTHCERIGREREEIVLTNTLRTVVRPTMDGAHEAYEELMSMTDAGPTPRSEYRELVGTPNTVIEQLDTYGDLGVDVVQIEPVLNDTESFDRFVDDVKPAFE